MDAEPGAVKTFLIPDVRGFTRFTNQRGDQAAAELTVRFSQIVRSVVEEGDGASVVRCGYPSRSARAWDSGGSISA